MLGERGNEPVRWPALAAALVVAAGGFLMLWGQGVDWRIALGTALLGGAAPAGAGELGRARAFGPRSHEDEVVDAAAHAVRGQREGGDAWPEGSAT